MTKIKIMLFIVPSLWLVPLNWQSASATDQSEIRKSAVFLEQIIGAWSVVLPKWNRDAKPEDWKLARQICATSIERGSPHVVDGADPKLPPDDMMFGTLVYYRGPDALQQFTTTDNGIRRFPDLLVGAAGNGSPVYQIKGNGESNAKITISIGKVSADGKPSIVMVRDGGLYLRCRQQ